MRIYAEIYIRIQSTACLHGLWRFQRREESSSLYQFDDKKIQISNKLNMSKYIECVTACNKSDL